MDKNITDMTCNGKCSGCGGCCTIFLPITKDELGKIERYVKKHNIKLKKRESVFGYDMQCAFLDPITKKCMIYEVRPFVCRDFICSNSSTWKEKRNMYAKRAFYNKCDDKGNISNMATFDDLIYDDPKALIINIIANMREQKVDPNIESQLLIETLINVGRKDIADSIKFN